MNKDIIDDGTVICYYQDGELHRADGPARIWNDGVAGWHLFGNYHRYYGPQDEEEWWIHGEQIK